MVWKTSAANFGLNDILVPGLTAIYFLDFLHRLHVSQPWLFPLAPSTGPTRVGTPDDEGRAIPRNIVVDKQGDGGESTKNRSQ
jgi:hypothetical protein